MSSTARAKAGRDLELIYFSADHGASHSPTHLNGCIVHACSQEIHSQLQLKNFYVKRQTFVNLKVLPF